MASYENMLAGGDLKSLGKTNAVIKSIKNQSQFDELFQCLHNPNPVIAMRAADAVEKITITNTDFLSKHKKELFQLCSQVKQKEVQWHLALLLPRLQLIKNEFEKAWHLLTTWAKDKTNSRIVRVHSIQGLFELLPHQKELLQDFILTLMQMEVERIPSIDARIRRFRKQMELKEKN